ncbi:hypothetical protein HY635_03700 [Candidatus Uhrbacteria bacterium]|nr:hypothetical protein [Candidatus Uhrbacteria bacterium]
MNGLGSIVLSTVFLVGAAALFVQNQRRIKSRSLGAFFMLFYALIFGSVGIAALTISTFDPTANPMAHWYALIAYAFCLVTGYCGAWFMLRGRK